MASFTSVLSRPLASLAKASAHRPIHVIILTALVTAVAYLSIVDEFISLNSIDVSQVSYYHPPNTNDYKDWTLIEDIALYPNAAHVGITPLSFKRIAENQIPAVEDTVFYADSAEKYLICDFDDVKNKLNNISQITTNDGTTWKTVHQYKISKYQEYAKSA